MLLNNGFWLFLLALSEATSSNELITVGSDFNCHYQPAQLYEAMQKHDKLYLTNSFVIQSLRIHDTSVHLVGGYDDCKDIEKGFLSHQRTVISGNKESVAVEIKARQNHKVTLENFEIKEGYGEKGGGIDLIKAKSLHLSNSLIYGNTSLGSGGGIQLAGNGIGVKINHSRIFQNQTENLGGGIAIVGESNVVEIKDSHIFANQASKMGGGFSCMGYNLIAFRASNGLTDAVVYHNLAPVGENISYELTCQIWQGNGQSQSLMVGW